MPKKQYKRRRRNKKLGTCKNCKLLGILSRPVADEPDALPTTFLLYGPMKQP